MIQNVTFTETKKIIYATETVILLNPGYKFNVNNKGQYPQWRTMLGARIEANREIREASELEKDKPQTYSKLSITETLETHGLGYPR